MTRTAPRPLDLIATTHVIARRVGLDIDILAPDDGGGPVVWITYTNRDGLLESDHGRWVDDRLDGLDYGGETQQAIEDAIRIALEDAS